MEIRFEDWLYTNHKMDKMHLDMLPDKVQLRIYKHWTTFKDNVQIQKNARHDGNHDEHK